MTETTHFGSRQVPLDEKQDLVDDVFHSVAHRYDLMNDLMSLGLHRAWKDALVTAVNPPQHPALLASRYRRRHRRYRVARDRGRRPRYPRDRLRHQCRYARRRPRARCESQALDDVVTFAEANAEALPFADRSFDAATIAFGIRNVPRIERALAEAFRVLKIGGRFLCLEFSAVDVPGLDRLYDFYSFNVIPALGRMVAGDAESYRYLVESIRRFPNPQAFAAMMRDGGICARFVSSR